MAELGMASPKNGWNVPREPSRTLGTELRLAGGLNRQTVLKQFLRFNRRPSSRPVDPAFRPLPRICDWARSCASNQKESGQGQHGEVPAPHPAVAQTGTAAAMPIGGRMLQGLDVLAVVTKGTHHAAQEVSPSPGSLRNGSGDAGQSPTPPQSTSGNGTPIH